MMFLEVTDRWRDATVELFLLEPSHVNAAYIGWLNDNRVNRFLESRFTNHDEESTRAFVENCLRNEGILMLGIRALAMDRQHIGNIKLGPIDHRHRTADIGILIGDPSAWGCGFARAAISRVCEIADFELRLRKLTAGCYASNLGSARAFESAGFEIEGRRPAQFLLNNQPEDLIQMGRLLTPLA